MKKDIKKDKLINWYDKLGKQLTPPPKLDKNFNQHSILPNSSVLAIGGSGTGKTNSLMTFLALKQEFYKIILYSGSTTDEPLYQYLQEKIPEMEFYTDIDEVPSLNDFDDDNKNKEKLIIFDDFINLTKKQMVKINQYLTAGRKFGFSVFLLAQNYVSVSKTITRNINYFIIFKLNDNVSINNIIRNHNIDDIEPKKFKDAYKYSTGERLNFFMIDLKGPKEKRFRHNFTEFLSIE